MSFQGDLRKFALNTGIRMDKIVRKVCLDLTGDLVKLTPVDTGHARSNWFFGTTRLPDIDAATIKSGAPSIKRGLEFVGTLKAGGTFYIVNNVPYIMQLEYGSSKQAPAGMARITVAKWQQVVNKAAGAFQ